MIILVATISAHPQARRRTICGQLQGLFSTDARDKELFPREDRWPFRLLMAEPWKDVLQCILRYVTRFTNDLCRDTCKMQTHHVHCWLTKKWICLLINMEVQGFAWSTNVLSRQRSPRKTKVITPSKWKTEQKPKCCFTLTAHRIFVNESALVNPHRWQSSVWLLICKVIWSDQSIFKEDFQESSAAMRYEPLSMLTSFE